MEEPASKAGGLCLQLVRTSCKLLTQPMSLTKEEAWAAGINQQQALAEKQAASPARLQMFVGLGFASVGIAAGVLIWCITTAYTFVRPEDSEEEEPTPSNEDEYSPPNVVP